MKTLLEILNSGTEYLQRQGCSEARSTMQHLMAHVLHCNRTYLYAHYDRPLSEDELRPLRMLLKKKAQGTPLQHLLGTTEFFRREFLTDRRALIPRPETEELVEYVLKYMRGDHLNILDMGTGAGVIGITLALELGARTQVTLADISQPALDLALENALRLGAQVRVVQSDLFSSLTKVGEQPGIQQGQSDANQSDSDQGQTVKTFPGYDWIVANLPYIANGEKVQKEVSCDPPLALYGGEKGWELIERFLREAPEYLSENALVALEIGYDQGEVVRQCMEDLGYRDIVVLRDLNGIPRFPLGRKPLNH